MVSPVRTSTVSFQTRFASGSPSRASTRNRPAPWTWNGWCIGWSESISFTRRIFTWSPTRNCQSIAWFGVAGVLVDQLPAHVGRRRDPVDLDHVVLPLDPADGGVVVAVVVVGMLVIVVVVTVRVVAVVVIAVVVLVAFVAVTAARRRNDVRRQELHAALRALVRRFADDLGVHRADVGDRRSASSFMPHFGHLPGSALTTSGCIGHV